MSAANLGLTVRPLRARDAKRACQLMAVAFEEEWAEAGFDVHQYGRLFRWLGAANPVLERIGWDGFKVLVAEVDGELVGSAIAYPIEPGLWFQSAVNVHPTYQGRGIGSLLYRRRLEAIHALGGRWACVDVRATNETALRIWRHQYGLSPLCSHTIYLLPPADVSPSGFLPGKVVPLTGTEPWIGQSHPLRLQLIRSPYSLRCSVATALYHRMLPPVTLSTWGYVDKGRLRAASRVRTLYPARLRFADFTWCDNELSSETLKTFLMHVLNVAAKRTRQPIWIYVRNDHAALQKACESLPVERYQETHYYLVDVAQALLAVAVPGNNF